MNLSGPHAIEDLRAAWEPLNEDHRNGRRYSSGVHLRIYRCFSWLQRADALDTQDDADLAFILRTVGFNSIWGKQWSSDQKRQGEHATWSNLLVAIADYDLQNGNRLHTVLREQSDLFQLIFDNPFFDREYWVEPGSEQLARSQEVAVQVEPALHEGQINTLLWQFTARMLLLRGQIIHGNSTLNGSLNRVTVLSAASAMDHILHWVLRVLIFDGGHDHDFEWEPVPYAPGETMPSIGM